MLSYKFKLQYELLDDAVGDEANHKTILLFRAPRIIVFRAPKVAKTTGKDGLILAHGGMHPSPRTAR